MSSLVKGSLLIAIGTVFKILLTILIDKFLAIELGVEDFGRFKYGVTLVLVLSTFCTLGFTSSVVRSLAIQADVKSKKLIISFASLAVALIAVLIVAVSLFLNDPMEVDAYFWIATVFYSLNTLFTGIYSGLEKPDLKVFINDIFGFSAYLLCLWLFFKSDTDPGQVAVVYLFYVVSVFLLNLVYSRRYFIKVTRTDLKQQTLQSFIRYSAPLFGVSVLIILSTHLDKFILYEFVSAEELGLYFAVFNISNLLPLLLVILVFLYLPRASRFMDHEQFKLAMLFNSYVAKWTMLGASLFFGVIYYYSEEVLVLLYSKDFTSAGWILKVLAFGQWINVSLGFTGQNLLALGDSRRQFWIRFLSFLFGTLLLIVLAREYGNFGAAIAIAIGLIFSNILQIIILRTAHNFRGYRKQNAYAFIIVIAIGVLLSQLHRIEFFQKIHFIAALLIDMLIFISSLFLSRVLNQKDLKFIKLIG